MGIQIYILSKLMEGNNYPYQIKKQLSEPIPYDQIGNLTESKLYYHFDSLQKQGLIETVEIIKEEHRPDKQVYRITEKGREELPKKIYKLFEQSSTISDMVVGLFNLQYVNREKVVEILEKNLRESTARWEHLLDFKQYAEKDDKVGPLNELLGNYFTTRRDHSITWMQEIIRQIKEGQI